MAPVIILAGGLATRLHPITTQIPKALVDVVGKPFIERQLELLRNNGFTEIILSVAYLGEMIEDLVGDGKKFGLNIRYLYDGDKFLGTGGAVKKTLDLFKEDTFIVLYGDSYLTISYQNILNSFTPAKYDSLMTVYKNGNLYDASNVIWDGKKIIDYDKKRKDPEMKHIDWGLNIFHRDAFSDFLNGSTFDLADVFRKSLKKGRLQGVEVFERFYEIGSHEGLMELNRLIKEGKC